ncbi:uncharacterized protein LOC124169095 [Ischnura elegans]|uniref:uncharacterized protein LOC124169095 n=1 Tax=Ischnura elegans TaxID=197161 RepID=UPI001ED872A8|nr:uncharacterized protein LOC124169095 [Ischnura elegans]
MFKLIALFAMLAMASAAPGLLPYVAPAAVVAHHPVALHAPLAYHTHIVKPVVPLATSYAHQYRVDYKTPALIAPVAYAPYAYAHAPFYKTFIH